MVKSPGKVNREEAEILVAPAANRLNLFVYGTLRLTADGVPKSMDGFYGDGLPLTHKPGAYRLDDWGIWTWGPGDVPGAGVQRGAFVIGDVFSINVDRFHALLVYEGYPSGYTFTEVEVVHRESGRTIKAVVFQATKAYKFGVLSPTGEWEDPGFTDQEAIAFLDRNQDYNAMFTPAGPTADAGPICTPLKEGSMCPT